MSYLYKFKVRRFGSNGFYQLLVENVHMRLRVLKILYVGPAVPLTSNMLDYSEASEFTMCIRISISLARAL